jgi:hypothetical protein
MEQIKAKNNYKDNENKPKIKISSSRKASVDRETNKPLITGMRIITVQI